MARSIPRVIESMTFGGKLYHRQPSGYQQSSKKSAQKYADSLRKMGMLVRVVPWERHGLFLVYWRGGRIKK